MFLRGDTAACYAMTLRLVLHPNGEDVDAMTGALARIQLRGLLRILEASDERTHTPNDSLSRPQRRWHRFRSVTADPPLRVSLCE